MTEQLVWIFEPPQPATDEADKVYESVIGKHPGYVVAIHHGAEIDPDLTEASGYNRYRNVPMIVVCQKGEKDHVSEPLRDVHLARFPRLAAWWSRAQGQNARTSVRLLPGITPADVAELDELGVHDCEALADADVHPHLTHLRDMARRLRTLAKPRMRLVDGHLQEVAA